MYYHKVIILHFIFCLSDVGGGQANPHLKRFSAYGNRRFQILIPFSKRIIGGSLHR